MVLDTVTKSKVGRKNGFVPSSPSDGSLLQIDRRSAHGMVIRGTQKMLTDALDHQPSPLEIALITNLSHAWLSLTLLQRKQLRQPHTNEDLTAVAIDALMGSIRQGVADLGLLNQRIGFKE
jgi:hypothetical protein